MSFSWHIALLEQRNQSQLLKIQIKPHLVDRYMSTDIKKNVHQRLIRTREIDGRTQGLDQPGSSLRRSEAVVVPERCLKNSKVSIRISLHIYKANLVDKKVRIVWYLVGRCAVSAGVTSPSAIHR